MIRKKGTVKVCHMLAALRHAKRLAGRKVRRFRQRLIPRFPRRYVNRTGVFQEGYYGGDRTLKLSLNVQDLSVGDVGEPLIKSETHSAKTFMFV